MKGKKKDSDDEDSLSDQKNGDNKNKKWWLANQPENAQYDLQTHWNIKGKNKKTKKNTKGDNESSSEKVSKQKRKNPFDPPKNNSYQLMTICNENKKKKTNKQNKVDTDESSDEKPIIKKKAKSYLFSKSEKIIYTDAESGDEKPIINKKAKNYLFSKSQNKNLIDDESETDSTNNEKVQIYHPKKTKSSNSPIQIQKNKQHKTPNSLTQTYKQSKPVYKNSPKKVEKVSERKSLSQIPKSPERKIKIDFLESSDSDSKQTTVKKKRNSKYKQNLITINKEEICSFYHISDYRVPNNNIFNNSSKALNLQIIENITNPKFNDELEDAEIRLLPNQFDQFFQIVTNHLKTESNNSKLCMKLLIAIDSVLYYDQAFDSLLKSDIIDYLPFSTPKLTILSFKVLKLLFMFRPSYFQEDFLPIMKHYLNIFPIELSLSLLILYSHSFEFIENPWPILDLLIKEKKRIFKQNLNDDNFNDENKLKIKKYFNNDPGVEADFTIDDTDESYLSILLYLNSNFRIYKENRLKYCRSIFIESLFDPTISKKAALVAYKAVICLYDIEFGEQISISSLFNDLKDVEFEKSSLQILAKMNVDLIPIKKKYILQLVNSAHVDEIASLILQKMMCNSQRNDKIASILLNNSKWLKFGLPTFSHTLMIFQSCVKFGNKSLLSEVKNCEEIPFFCKALLNSDNINDIEQISQIFNEIDFDDFVSLSENNFFEILLDKISTIKNVDVLPFINLISDLAKIRYSSYFKKFIPSLKKLLKNEDDNIFHASLKAVANLSAYKKCAEQILNQNVISVAEKNYQSQSDMKIIKRIKKNLES